MILSDTNNANIDWKLNQLLSASKASRSYMTRTHSQVAAVNANFAPWEPPQVDRKIPKQAADDKRQDSPTDSRGSDTMQPGIDADAGSTPEVIQVTQATDRILSEAALEQLIADTLAEGRRQAISESAALVADNEAQFKELIDAVAVARVDITTLKNTVAELACFIARQVVRAELTVNEQWIDTLTTRCVEEIRLHGTDSITVRLNRGQYNSHIARLSARHESVTFAPDDRLQPGDVELEMGATQISEIMAEKLSLIGTQLLASLTDSVSDAAPAVSPVAIEP
jgi:flagellar biosynthesis/type III secretory pathway protein FliH